MFKITIKGGREIITNIVHKSESGNNLVSVCHSKTGKKELIPAYTIEKIEINL